MLRMNPTTKLSPRELRKGSTGLNRIRNTANGLRKAQHYLPPRSGRSDKESCNPSEEERSPSSNPYSLCVLVKPRNENADSPSKNWVSGITPLASSRLSHPLPGIVNRELCLNVRL